MFENLPKRKCSVSEREPEKNQYGAYGLDVDFTGIESSITVWMDNKYPNDCEQDMAEFIAYCFNLQQRFDIGKLEEAANALDEIKSMCDGNITNENNIWHKCNNLLTQIKK